MNPGLSYVRLTTSYIKYRTENHVIPTHHMTHSKCRRPPGRCMLATTLRWALSLYFKVRKIYSVFKWKLIVGSGHNISYYTTAQLSVHVRMIWSAIKNVYHNIFYEITIKSSKTLVKRKFPLQYVREQPPTNTYQKPRTRGNNGSDCNWIDARLQSLRLKIYGIFFSKYCVRTQNHHVFWIPISINMIEADTTPNYAQCSGFVLFCFWFRLIGDYFCKIIQMI